MQNLEQTIRERAYHLWIADGRRDGNAEAHWLSAQREILATSLELFARVKADQGTAKAGKKSVQRIAAKGKRRAA